MIVSAVLLLMVILFAAWFDWNMVKPYVERQVTEKTGRDFVIRGEIDVDLSLNPLISLGGMTLANAEWGTRQPMLAVDRTAFRISLWNLLLGDIVLPEVSVSQPKLLLEKSVDGKRNWDLRKDEKKETELPEIGRLTLDQGELVFRDPKSKTDIDVSVHTDPAIDAREMPLDVSAEGTLKSLEFRVRARGGKVMSLADKKSPYPIQIKAEIGTTHADVEGTVTGLAELSSADLKLDLSGEDLSALYPIVGVVIFPSPPYRISGRLVREKEVWSMHGFSGHVGKSDLGGNIFFDTGGDRPMLRADLVSKVLDLNDLKGFISARRGPKPEDTPKEKREKKASREAQRDRLLPDKHFSVERLRAMDANVKFTGASIRNEKLPVEKLIAHLKIDDGLMTLDPADFAVAGGNVIARMTINARKDVPSGEVQVDFKQLQLPKLLPDTEITKESVGLLGGQAKVKGKGESVGTLLASADGRFALFMSGGQISNMMLEMIGLDAGETIKFLFAGDKNARIRCGVSGFDIKDGMMTSEVFILDTADTNIVGEGQVNLVEETIDLKLSPQPKDVTFPSLRTPIHIGGTFKDPTILPDKVLAVRIGAAVVLGVFATPFAALIPLIDIGLGEDNDCKTLIEAVKTGKKLPEKNSAPVKEKEKEEEKGSKGKNRDEAWHEPGLGGIGAGAL